MVSQQTMATTTSDLDLDDFLIRLCVAESKKWGHLFLHRGHSMPTTFFFAGVESKFDAHDAENFKGVPP